MVLVLDRSGSMEGKIIRLAKEAARRAVAMLGPRDQMGVHGLRGQQGWISPIARLQRQAAGPPAAWTRSTAGGETDMGPAMDKAYLALRECSAELKHIIG